MGYRTKINGRYTEDHFTWMGWEEIAFPIMSPFCLGGCRKQLINCCPERWIVPGGYCVCGECITAYCEKHDLEVPDAR